jgi:malate dehydrogenase (oxaloacetate-decarboxylating)(NADP+)
MSLKSHPSGYNLLKNPWKNKGTSFSDEERTKYGLHGLLPAGEPKTLDSKVEIAMGQLRKKSSPIEKYNFLHTIQDSDETLFYAILAKYTKETMPLVYTPTVGQACLEWSHVFRQQPRGVYISVKDAGNVEKILANYPNKDIKVIVLTDGERILGLGDLGANGMGIPIGKLALYTTCAGIHPEQVLPVTIDVGTNTESILNDPAYVGLRQKRDRSQKYDELIEEFIRSANKLYGRTVLFQFEDFGNTNAFRLLERYRGRTTTFNDDIQGTASVVLAGLLASNALTGKQKLSEHRFLFLGAGEAGTGIADLISAAIVQQTGMSLAEAKKRSFFVDSRGMVCSARGNLEHHKQAYAHDLKDLLGYSGDVPATLSAAVDVVKPTAIIGVSAQGGAFTKEVIEKMARLNDKPLIFALSNPTNKAECTAAEAYTHSQGKCVFASGSPFDPVTLPNGQHFVPGQGNNAYIFPAVGLAAVAAKALTIEDEDFIVAAKALAELVPQDKLDVGCCYPDLSNIREVSLKIAAAVAKHIYESKRSELADKDKVDWVEFCRKHMYTPSYHH